MMIGVKKYYECDTLVVGSGIAGLFAALSIDPLCSVALITKAKLRNNNSFYAQGGVAVALREPSDIASHKQDTLNTGLGLCDELAVDILVNEGPERVRELILLGVEFDRNPDNQYEYLKEGAHSSRRILHVRDRTGYNIQKVLVDQVKRRSNISIFETTYLDRLLVEENVCNGADFFSEAGERIQLRAKTVILASGGAGMVYERTTNWKGSTGDGLSAAFLAGAVVRDMEFYQFHPTAIQLKKPGIKNFLISESVRGEGAIVIDQKGDRFLFKYDPRGELASRDIVSLAIYEHMQLGNKVFLDLRELNDPDKRFPFIYKNCFNMGHDLKKSPIQVFPVAHYMIGGIKANETALTEINDLYVCGEAASSGVHGANRLASNSLLECLVFGFRAAKSASEKNYVKSIVKKVIDYRKEKEISLSSYALNKSKHELQKLMFDKAGIKRDFSGLIFIKKYLDEKLTFFNKDTLNVSNPVAYKEYQNMLITSSLIVKSAISREESRGAHCRTDFSQTGSKSYNTELSRDGELNKES